MKDDQFALSSKRKQQQHTAPTRRASGVAMDFALKNLYSYILHRRCVRMLHPLPKNLFSSDSLLFRFLGSRCKIRTHIL